MIFKALSKEEFERLSVDERMDYLHRLMADLRQKLEETRHQAERMKQGAK
jgi:PHD/YefM family antitoxin component YafN of YafNO toxin-antitoxin module